jgi:hypothetical protein
MRIRQEFKKTLKTANNTFKEFTFQLAFFPDSRLDDGILMLYVVENGLRVNSIKIYRYENQTTIVEPEFELNFDLNEAMADFFR